MALATFAVSKRRSSRLAADALGIEAPETGRTQTLSNSILDLRTEGEVVEEVSKLWNEAQEKFLAIGRYLRDAKARFSGTFEKQIVAALPFGKNIAYSFARWLKPSNSGRLPEESLPRSYATAFQLVTLSPPDFETGSVSRLGPKQRDSAGGGRFQTRTQGRPSYSRRPTFGSCQRTTLPESRDGADPGSRSGSCGQVGGN